MGILARWEGYRLFLSRVFSHSNHCRPNTAKVPESPNMTAGVLYPFQMAMPATATIAIPNKNAPMVRMLSLVSVLSLAVGAYLLLFFWHGQNALGGAW